MNIILLAGLHCIHYIELCSNVRIQANLSVGASHHILISPACLTLHLQITLFLHTYIQSYAHNYVDTYNGKYSRTPIIQTPMYQI